MPFSTPRFATRFTSAIEASIGLLGIEASPGEALRLGGAEIGEPVVVHAHYLDGRVGVVQPAGGAEHAVEHLALDAIAVLVFGAQLGVGKPAYPALAVLVETGCGHAVGPVNSSRRVHAAGRAHPVHHAEIGAALRPSTAYGRRVRR
jgi:hypothetical protein